MRSIKRIVCPIDFSETSVHAAEHALAVARWHQARIVALHVHAPVVAPIPSLTRAVERVSDGELRQTRDRLCAFMRAAGGRGLAIDVAVDVGHPATLILERAAAVPADLIVMGTHGATGIEHLLLGSVAETVLRKAGCPVLTVPPRVRATSRVPFVRVLCAVDFSHWSPAAIELATSLAVAAGASLDLLHVIEWPWEEPPPPDFDHIPAPQAHALIEFRRFMIAGARARLESLAATAGSRCAVGVQVAHGKPYVEILRAAAVGGADAVVLGVHGRNPIDVTMFGSTTNQVVRRATCPVLTVRR
jgi:nucleotide-binding universal stress UspA family protein